MKFEKLSIEMGDRLFIASRNLNHESYGKLLAVLFLLWDEGSKQSLLPISSELFSRIFKSESEIQAFCDTIANQDSKLLSSALDFDAQVISFSVQSTYLREKFEKEKVEHFEQEQILKMRRETLKKSSSMSEMMSEKKEYHRLYVDLDRRQLHNFEGFFPLANFNVDGSAFNIRSEHKSILINDFAKYDINVDEQLLNMFCFLRDNPIKRKLFGHMNRFILNWLSNVVSADKNQVVSESDLKKCGNNIDAMLESI